MNFIFYFTMKMTKTYNITREVAASMLNISTRTIDRYIKSWKLSYKKVANKVLMAREEISELQEEFSLLRQEVNTEIVWNQEIWSSNSNHSNSMAMNRWSLEASIDEKVDKFFLIFKEKDKMLEEKNKIIFVLQQRVNELESKIQNMVALPDYTKEKQELLIEKEKLEMKIDQLKWTVKWEKTKNLVFMSLMVVCIIIAIFFMMK